MFCVHTTEGEIVREFHVLENAALFALSEMRETGAVLEVCFVEEKDCSMNERIEQIQSSKFKSLVSKR